MNRYLPAIITSGFYIFVHIGITQIFGLELGEFIHIFLMYAPLMMLSLVYARENNLLIPILFHMYNKGLATYLMLVKLKRLDFSIAFLIATLVVATIILRAEHTYVW
ncbi:hypothetical protein RZE82_06910 [Mollicutes bacterium LVI A0039]|nr:hypothetical protein RZE82_06910 [Mollicutes bacterium LVI A0039]